MANAFLRRYTDLPVLLALLATSRLTLLDPERWEDTNDSHYMKAYKRKAKLSILLAACFAEATETYHHWRVFAPGSSGVCLRFRKASLVSSLKAAKGVRYGPVNYLTLAGARKSPPSLEQLPFIKRAPFQSEMEFRVIYSSSTTSKTTHDIPIDLASIDRIILSPWVHSNLVPHIKSAIAAIKGCRTLEVTRSSLIGNDIWKQLGDDAA